MGLHSSGIKQDGSDQAESALMNCGTIRVATSSARILHYLSDIADMNERAGLTAQRMVRSAIYLQKQKRQALKNPKKHETLICQEMVLGLDAAKEAFCRLCSPAP
jgi:hypothetical protein